MTLQGEGWLRGENGNDLLYAGAYATSMAATGGLGADTVTGSNGNDHLSGNTWGSVPDGSFDFVDGRGGNDACDLSTEDARFNCEN